MWQYNRSSTIFCQYFQSMESALRMILCKKR